MAPLKIKVGGDSVISRPAERAIMTVTVSNTGPVQKDVATEVTNTSNELQKLLRSFAPKDSEGIATLDASITHWTMSSLSTRTNTEQDRAGNRNRTFTVTTHFTIKFADFNKLGFLSTQLSVLPNVAIHKIAWALTDETQASFATESRQDAVKDAFVKAQDYAEAAGKKTIRPVDISDRGRTGNAFGVQAQGHGGAYSSLNLEESGLTFAPEHVKITSSVLVEFEAE